MSITSDTRYVCCSTETLYALHVLRHLEDIDLSALVAQAKDEAAKNYESVEDELASLLEEEVLRLYDSGWSHEADIYFALDAGNIGPGEYLEPWHLFIGLTNCAISKIDYQTLAEMILNDHQ